MNNENNFQKFLNGYLECAAWADAPEEKTHLEFKKSAVVEAEKDCRKFFNAHHNSIPKDSFPQAGHDFWLTRNHHGAGFWDREEIYGKETATHLTTLSHAFGECHIYIAGRGGSECLDFGC